MKNYLELMNEVLVQGVEQKNRTGINSIMIPGAVLKFDLSMGFPAVTTKKLAFNSVVGELIGFLKGYNSADKFRELGCKVWDQNANKNKDWLSNPHRKGIDDLGAIYAVQWRKWYGGGREGRIPRLYDQIEVLLNTIRNNPTSRRMVVSAWRPDEFDMMALPPCHIMFQVIIDNTNKLMHMNMYQRSCDLFLGVPFNIASYALLLHILCEINPEYTPGTLTWMGGDVHIYVNHIDQCKLQLSRKPYPLPQLCIKTDRLYIPDTKPVTFANKGIELFDSPEFLPDLFSLINYNYHPPISAEMAV